MLSATGNPTQVGMEGSEGTEIKKMDQAKVNGKAGEDLRGARPRSGQASGMEA